MTPRQERILSVYWMARAVAARSALHDNAIGDLDDYHHDAVAALCEAADRWDETRGAWTTFAWAHMWRTMSHLWRKRTATKRKAPRTFGSDTPSYGLLSSRDEPDETRDVLGLLALFSEQHPREWSVLVQHLAEGRTLREIGAELGVTNERVRQIEKSALRKCRLILAAHGCCEPPPA